MAQQTAVEWLFEEITGLKVKSNFELFKKDLEQAKAMEKEQIMHSWENGALPDLLKEFKNSRIYYNETYNK